MAVFNPAGMTPAQLIANVQGKLEAHRQDLNRIKDLHDWSSGISSADLVAIGFASQDATDLLSSINDAYGEYLIHTTGSDPNHPPAGAPYVYAASQNRVLGPGSH